MSIESDDDLKALQRVGKLVSGTIRTMLAALRPGITTRELDEVGREYFAPHGARYAPQLTYGFPGATCISVNHEAAHGIPGDRKVEPGDLVTVDVSLELNGYFADSGATKIVPPVRPDLGRLCEASYEILMRSLRELKGGSRLNQVGRTIENESRKRGYTVIRNLAGHGVGRSLHEEPYDLVNYRVPSDRRLARTGQVVAIETFISTGAEYVVEQPDGWTLKTPDQSYVAQFEHTVVITNSAPLVLTA